MTTKAEQVTEVRVRYDADAPALLAEEGAARLRLPTDGVRGDARLAAELARPGVVRDALLTVGEILASDLRRKASDRSDYLAYLLSKGQRATKAVWDAQKAFLEEKYGEASEGQESPLDPLLTVDEQGLAIKVFSRDESAYARLALKAGEAYQVTEQAAGTTHLDVSPAVLSAVSRMRSYRATSLELVPSSGGQERALRVPYRWLRAFGQVQAASTLPAETFELAPVDLYNVLLTLRMRRAKKGPRALRYELVPGEPPRLVLEPWDLVIEGTGGPYRGGRPQVVRTWGRKRLSVLAPLLPHARSVRVCLVGAGLPAYYVIDLGDTTLTLALSGWTDSGWAGIATFDLLVPAGLDDLLGKQLLKQLAKGAQSLDQLAEGLGRDRNDVRQAVLAEMTRGTVLHDLATGTFVHRPLCAEPLDAEQLRYRDAREEQAHRLLAKKGQVELTRVHDLGGEGTTIEGEVDDKQAHRQYRSSFTIDREGRTTKAACTCPAFRRAGLREGPCEHMIAVRLSFARQRAELERARGTVEGRKLIRAETRTLIRREGQRATSYRISLDDRQVVVRWGASGELPEQMRMHRLLFDSADAAREEYFGRLDRLGGRGYIDASAAESP